MIYQQQQENVEYFIYLGRAIRKYARCTLEIKPKIAMAKAALKKRNNLSTSKLDLRLKNKLKKCFMSAYLCMVLKLGYF
jgi:hypothetical protein